MNFDFSSDKIRSESKQTLDQIAGILEENSEWKMMVEGHTDSICGESFNRNLSEKRAESVKSYPIDAKIDASRLLSAGHGLSKPVASNETEAGRARNRRVELVKQ
ncbi:MAG: OmpA family protein [Pyrinomonadaceae bacterium]|nr:OmpA family protein [Pyrinomonadaceae bacterium]